MNVGRQTIEWLHSRANLNAQIIEIIGERQGPDGQTGYLIGVRTDLIRDLDLTDRVAEDINTGLMRTAALAGPVYDAETRRLSLCSLALVHDDNAQWMRVLLGAAASTQLAEAMLLGPGLESGEMASAATAFVDDGRLPCRWMAEDFESLGASSGDKGLTVKFPYADGSSLCRMSGDQRHPLYGSGLTIMQRFPFSAGSPANGARLALALNQDDLSIHPAGYGFGSYAYVDNKVCFLGFVPHGLKDQVSLGNLYYSCAARARSVAERLTTRISR